ncbi:hypothetical protein [Elizabethkingia anophelis]|uniref:hypothetical protein n=1 Tax=Elizabethkingia anophelis TaxID=1117645 RepID=UPI0038921E2F
MSNKTALQELIEKLESELYELDTKCDISEINDGVRFAYNHILTLIDDGILEKEKQQIMEAWLSERDMTWINSNGEDATIEDLKPNAEDYFNSKYGLGSW